MTRAIGVNSRTTVCTLDCASKKRLEAGPEIKPGQDFLPVTRPDLVAFDPVTLPDPTQLLSIVKQILDNGLTAVSITCQETQTV